MPLSDYLITVALISVTVGILDYLSYPSKMREAVRIFASVIIIYALITPVLTFVNRIPDNGNLGIQLPSELPNNGTYETVAKQAFENGICKLLYTKYGIDDEDVSVSAQGFDVREMRAERIVVILSGRAALVDYRGVEEYISGLSLGNCEVKIRIG
jgi:hypothetical protein